MTIKEIYEAREFKTVTEVSGPLMFVDLQGMGGVSYGEIVEILTTEGERRRGQVHIYGRHPSFSLGWCF